MRLVLPYIFHVNSIKFEVHWITDFSSNLQGGLETKTSSWNDAPRYSKYANLNITQNRSQYQLEFLEPSLSKWMLNKMHDVQLKKIAPSHLLTCEKECFLSFENGDNLCCHSSQLNKVHCCLFTSLFCSGYSEHKVWKLDQQAQWDYHTKVEIFRSWNALASMIFDNRLVSPKGMLQSKNSSCP